MTFAGTNSDARAAAPPDYRLRKLRSPDGGLATLIHLQPTANEDPAVLYVHGWSDYFVQDHLAQHVADRGLAFCAIDLRHYGRSLRAGDLPGFVTSLGDHFEDLDRAAEVIRADGHQELVVLGHSFGGLLTSLWLHDRRGGPSLDGVPALVLNAPWLDIPGTPVRRRMATVGAALDRVLPRRVVDHGSVIYHQSIHRDHRGEWDFDLICKPPGGFPVRADWLRAVKQGQARLARGLDPHAGPLPAPPAQPARPAGLDSRRDGGRHRARRGRHAAPGSALGPPGHRPRGRGRHP